MATAFKKSNDNKLIGTARKLVREYETKGVFDETEWESFRNDLLDYVKENTDTLYTNFESYLKRKRRLDTVPAIFAGIRDRYKLVWEANLRKMFATAYTVLSKGRKQDSFFMSVTSWLGRVFGLTGSRSAIQSGGSFKVAGKEYWLYPTLYAASNAPTRSFRVETLEILTEFDTEGGRVQPFKPLIGIEYGGKVLIVEGAKRLREVVRRSVRQVPVKVLSTSDIKESEVSVKVGTGSRSMKLVSYLELLFRTIPANMERELVKYEAKILEDITLYRVVGGLVHNSAHTCRFCDGKVLTEDAITYVTSSRDLKDRLFHPNCRHRLETVPSSYNGRVWDATDVRARNSNGVLR